NPKVLKELKLALELIEEQEKCNDYLLEKSTLDELNLLNDTNKKKELNEIIKQLEKKELNEIIKQLEKKEPNEIIKQLEKVDKHNADAENECGKATDRGQAYAIGSALLLSILLFALTLHSAPHTLKADLLGLVPIGGVYVLTLAILARQPGKRDVQDWVTSCQQ
ncbi:MAG: hypothetical protein VXZ72_05140, partial [Chlamydiota bacterium]|nr:hypothetical protein [Chlamydiota bacterium]